MSLRLVRRVGSAVALAWSATACLADGPVSPFQPQPQLGGPGAIQGRVMNADSDTPLHGANAQLFAVDGRVVQSVGTDEDGRYVFQPVPAGSYRVRVRAIGYRPAMSAPMALDASTGELPRVSLKKDVIRCFATVVTAPPGDGSVRKADGVPVSAVPLYSTPASKRSKRPAPKG